MKKFIKIITLSLLIVISACKKDEKLIFESITDNTGEAGGLRTISILSPSIDLFDITNSQFSVEVEEFDHENGGLLDFVDVFVQFNDNTPDNGDSSAPEILVRTIPASAFIDDSASGLPRTTITVTAQEAVDLLGLDSNSDIDGGDIFRVRLALNLTDGQVFSSGNLEGNITGVFFSSPFTYPANVVCELDPAFMTGTYQMVFVSGSGPFGDSFGDEQVTITSNSGTQRTTQATWLIGGGPQTFTFDLVCGRINVPLYATGLGCGGVITWQTTGSQGTFDSLDDSQFTVRFNDFVADGGCGVGTYEVMLMFTKL